MLGIGAASLRRVTEIRSGIVALLDPVQSLPFRDGDYFCRRWRWPRGLKQAPENLFHTPCFRMKALVTELDEL